MTDRILTRESFPRFRSPVAASWVPVFLEPIAGSAERLVIGIAITSSDGVHVQAANSLSKLKCLYGKEGESVANLAGKAICHLNDQLRKSQDVSLNSLKGLFEGVQIGEIRAAEGESLSAIANSWLSVVSSLHEHRPEFALVSAAGRAVEYAAVVYEPVEQLANQIMHEVISNRAALEKFFSSDIRSGRLRRVRGKAHHVLIDYAGSQLVANFDVMKADRITKSVDSIKRRLWDLKVDRDQESSGLSQRRHEMIVQAPKSNDPTLSETQSSNVEDALNSLEEQADQEELRLIRLETTNAIAARVLEVEAA